MRKVQIESSARIYGKVRLGDGAYISQGTVLRSVGDSVQLGNATWVLENSVLIGTPEFPLQVGSKTIFGHKCIAIGARIGNLCEIGNGTIFLPGSRIGNRCIFGEGTLVPENSVIPDDSVVIGRPAKILRRSTREDKEMIARMRGGNVDLPPYSENIIENEPQRGEIMGKLYSFDNKFPQVSASAVLHDTAELTGDVIVGDNTHIASGVKIIGDSHGPVRIGNNVHILENCVLHLLPDNELIIEDGVTIGPGCMIHGTTIGAGSIVESGSVVCDNSKLGSNVLVKAGSLVKQRSQVEDNCIVEGFPATVVGKNPEKMERPRWSMR